MKFPRAYEALFLRFEGVDAGRAMMTARHNLYESDSASVKSDKVETEEDMKEERKRMTKIKAKASISLSYTRRRSDTRR